MNTSVLEPQPKPDLDAVAPAPRPKPKAGVDTDTANVWTEAYNCEIFKKILKKRAAFFVPALCFSAALFLVLWVMQASFPAVARYRVYGFINVNFVYTMAIFPVIWIIGYLFVRYIRREVYPLEDELHRRFGKGSKYE